MTAAYDAALAPLGINIGQYALLKAVARNQPVSLTALGHAMELDRSTIGRNARVLERLDLITSERGEADQRAALLRMTRRGDTLLNRAFPLWEACQRDLEGRLGGGKLATLEAILDAI